jgi:hypothetical protein
MQMRWQKVGSFLIFSVDAFPAPSHILVPFIIFVLQRPWLTLLIHSVIFSYTLQNSIQAIAVVIAGRLGPDELFVAASFFFVHVKAGVSYLAGRLP